MPVPLSLFGVYNFDPLSHQRSVVIRAVRSEKRFTITNSHLLPIGEDLGFGKGRDPAELNFGDCCSDALAKHRAEPLRFKGRDFSRTDVLTS